MLRALSVFAISILLATIPVAAAAESYRDLRAEAEAGGPDGAFSLALCLYESEQPADRAEGVEWARKAAAAGDAEAKNAVAVGILQGFDPATDPDEGWQWMVEAAHDGALGAMITLGFSALDGRGPFADDAAKALSLLTRASEHPKIKDQTRGRILWSVGMMHLQGAGTTPDPVTAYGWISRSADSGFSDAMISRAVMLATGEGVQEDDVAAREWYRRAIVADDDRIFHAMRGLGGMLWFGEGGPVDRAEGCKLVTLAEAGGDEHAKTLRTSFFSQMTEEENRACLAAAEAWVAARKGD